MLADEIISEALAGTVLISLEDIVSTAIKDIILADIVGNVSINLEIIGISFQEDIMDATNIFYIEYKTLAKYTGVSF